MAQPTKTIYTISDIYALPDGERAELIDGRGCNGAPDWIIEITSPSNPAHDHVLKLHLYMDAGVREYWIVDPTQKMVYVYHLVMEEFKMTAHTFQDKIKAGIYDDLWIDFSGLDL